jgi:hypothetical protein
MAPSVHPGFVEDDLSILLPPLSQQSKYLQPDNGRRQTKSRLDLLPGDKKPFTAITFASIEKCSAIKKSAKAELTPIHSA